MAIVSNEINKLQAMNDGITKSNYAINIILVLSIIFFSSYSNELSRNIFLTTIPLCILFLMVTIKGMIFDKNGFYIIIVYSIFLIIYFTKFGEFDPLFSYSIFMYIFYSYLLIKIVGIRFFEYFAKIVYWLALISLPLFLMQNIFFNSFYNISLKIQDILNLPYTHHDIYLCSNILIYTIKFTGFHRNCGPMFEPGAFAIILGFALFFSFAFEKVRFKNFKVIILTIALLTTFSTTGYLLLFVVLIFYFITKKDYIKNKRKKMMFVYCSLIIVPLVFIIVTSKVPFMYDKISSLLFRASNEFYIHSHFGVAQAHSDAYSLGRFAGLLMDFKDLLTHPFFGVGGHQELLFKNVWGLNIASINGIGHFLTIFGIVGSLLAIYNIYRSGKKLSYIYDVKVVAYLFILIFISSFSFNTFIFSPLFFTFQTYYLATNGIRFSHKQYSNPTN